MYERYGDDRRSERPVRLEKTEGTVVIEGRVYPAREIVEALAQSGYTEIRSSGDSLILGRKRIAPIFKSRKERAMAALCHGSLAYCCPMSKRCAERDRALEILGISQDEYHRMKNNAHHEFLDVTYAPSGSNERRSQRPRRGTVNQPASDYGYGSDDYRRDFETLDRAMQRDSRDSPAARDHSSWTAGRRREHDESSYPQRSGNPFTDVRMDGSLMEEMKRSTEGLACSTCGDDSYDGIASLFTQGELSPYNEDSDREDSQTSFCFSCGRTYTPGTKVCPYCGATQ